MIFFENERSKVWTLRASFQGIARFFATLGGFDLGWYWLGIIKLYHAEKQNASFFEDIVCADVYI